MLFRSTLNPHRHSPHDKDFASKKTGNAHGSARRDAVSRLMISIGIAYWQNEVKLRMETIAEHGSRRRRLHLVFFRSFFSSDERIQQGIVNRLNRALDRASREQSLNRTLARLVVVEPTKGSCFPTTGICLGIQWDSTSHKSKQIHLYLSIK